MERPLIMITNDDGFEAAGIRALADAAMPLGDVIIVAPARGSDRRRAAAHTPTPGLQRSTSIQHLGHAGGLRQVGFARGDASPSGLPVFGHKPRQQQRKRRDIFGHYGRGHRGMHQRHHGCRLLLATPFAHGRLLAVSTASGTAGR